MSDGYVQAPSDSSGKKVDAEETTSSSGTVERLRMSIPDQIRVRGDLLELIYQEIMLTNDLLAQAFGLGNDITILRNGGYNAS